MHTNIASAVLLERCMCATARPHRHTCEVVSDKESKFNSNTKVKILQVVIETEQSDAVPSS